MLSGIGSWTRHESSGRFVASRLPEEREANLPEAHYREFAACRVLRVCKHYAVTQRLILTHFRSRLLNHGIC